MPRANLETNDNVDEPRALARADPQNEPSGYSQSNSQQMCQGGSLNSKRKREADGEACIEPPPTAPKKGKKRKREADSEACIEPPPTAPKKGKKRKREADSEACIEPPPTAPKKGKKRKREADSEACPEPPPTAPKKGKKNKKLKKLEREEIAHSLKQLDLVVLIDEVASQLKLQYGERSLNKLVDLLCSNEQLLKEMLECYRNMFIHLYLDTGKKKDPFLNFLIKWNHHCSAMPLEELYSLTEIDLDKQLSKSLKALRTKWLDFCKSSGFPIPVSNPVMITLSSTIYNTLIAHINLKGEEDEIPTEVNTVDGDDVYFRFGGAAICEMLHLRYEQIKIAPFSKKDGISQEITILQAINSKDKSAIPNYLKYRDLGFMYFPHPTFIPLLRNLDTTLKEVVNPSGIEKYGNSLIKVMAIRYCFGY